MKRRRQDRIDNFYYLLAAALRRAGGFAWVLAIALATGMLWAQPASSASPQLTPLKLTLDWFVNPDHAPLVIAVEKGFFADEGLAVTLIEPGNPNDPPKLVAAGSSDLAVTYQPQLHIQADRGLPLMRIATLIATPLNSLVVLADGPIETIADLAGKRVGFSVAGFEDVLLAAMLDHHHVALDTVEKTHVNFALTPALLSGAVDAVIGAFRNFELPQLELAGARGRAFYVEEEGVPTYDELIIVVHRDAIDERWLVGFLRALERATAYLINHPETSWDIFRQRYPVADNELNARAWVATLPRFALRPRALDRQRYYDFAAFLIQRGVITSPPPLHSYAIEISMP